MGLRLVRDFLRLSGTNNRFPMTAMANFCFFLLQGGLAIDLELNPDLLGLKQSRPGIKSPRKSQTT